MDLLAGLTPPQQEAVTHIDGPLLVLAGAGSGKTRVITRRVAHLISQGIPPWHILGLTFTNKAADEMRGRVAELVQARGLTMATFHSFCARVLRMHGDLLGIEPGFTIYDSGEAKRAVKQAVESAGLDPTHWNPDRLAARISHVKNRLEPPETYAANNTDFSGKHVAKVYTTYQQMLKANNALDFDDLLMRVALGLKQSAELRDLLQDRYQYVLIDEYQDTNDAQYRIAATLAERHRNICATGDPDQSIYGWRGANLNNILDFEKDFKGCKVVRLEENWRSTPQILGAASRLIRHNRNRKKKDLVTTNAAGTSVRVVEHESGDEEARAIAEAIAAAHPDGRGIGQVAVFYRVNALSRSLEDALRTAGVPYEIVRGTSFYERLEVRNLVAYLRVLVNPADDMAVARIINTPTRGIGATTISHVETFARERGLSLLEACRRAGEVADLKPRAVGSVKKFVTLIDELSAIDRSSIGALVQTVVERTGYEAYCRKLSDGDDERLANVAELITLAVAFDDEPLPEGDEVAEKMDPLGRFLERVSLSSDQDSIHEEIERVHLMTLHAAKGLEFPTVYIVGLEEGLLPHMMAEEEGRDSEEERRLCFVGMTRAKQRLTLSFARYRTLRGERMRQGPSRFLREIGDEGVERELLEEDRPAATGLPRLGEQGAAFSRSFQRRASQRTYVQAEDADEAVIEAATRDQTCPYQSGQWVKHPTFGTGQIAGVSGSGANTKIRIRFPHMGEKTFVAQYAKLKILKR